MSDEDGMLLRASKDYAGWDPNSIFGTVSSKKPASESIRMVPPDHFPGIPEQFHSENISEDADRDDMLMSNSLEAVYIPMGVQNTKPLDYFESQSVGGNYLTEDVVEGKFLSQSMRQDISREQQAESSRTPPLEADLSFTHAEVDRKQSLATSFSSPVPSPGAKLQSTTETSRLMQMGKGVHKSGDADQNRSPGNSLIDEEHGDSIIHTTFEEQELDAGEDHEGMNKIIRNEEGLRALHEGEGDLEDSLDGRFDDHRDAQHRNEFIGTEDDRNVDHGKEFIGTENDDDESEVVPNGIESRAHDRDSQDGFHDPKIDSAELSNELGEMKADFIEKRCISGPVEKLQHEPLQSVTEIITTESIQVDTRKSEDSPMQEAGEQFHESNENSSQDAGLSKYTKEKKLPRNVAADMSPVEAAELIQRQVRGHAGRKEAARIQLNRERDRLR